MSSSLVVHRPASVLGLSAAALRKKLTDASQLRCTAGGENGATRFVLGQNDVAVVLRIDGDDKPNAAFLEFSLSTKIPTVTALCKTFRALGWTFQL